MTAAILFKCSRAQCSAATAARVQDEICSFGQLHLNVFLRFVCDYVKTACIGFNNG